MTQVTFTVAGMSCSHCAEAVASELRTVPGVDAVTVDLDTKLVVVTGGELDDAVLRAAVADAGYEAA